MTKYFVYSIFFILSSISNAEDTSFKVVKKGKTSLYEYYGKLSQDLSGAAFDGKSNMLFGFDGGRNSQSPEIRFVSPLQIDKPGKLINRKVVQKDIEGMAFTDDSFYAISSMSQANEDTHDFRILSEIVFDKSLKKVTSERFVYLRKKILKTLIDKFKDKTWFSRVSSSFGKHGGLNVEGLSATNAPGELLIGLRSPLWSKNFGSPIFGDNISLEKGKAILVKMNKPFSKKPKMVIKTVDLGGQGIRGIEYVSELDSYIIISGPVAKGTNFNLWSYHRRTKSLQKIDTPEFNDLCRPESIVPVESENIFYVLSEESGALCEKTKFTYLKVEYEI